MTTGLSSPPSEPPRRSPSPLMRLREQLHHMRLWFRRTFTREAVVSNLKTMMWVAPLTVLIWLYAEREQTSREEDVRVVLDIRSDDPGRIVTVVRGEPDNTVLVNLRGPRSRLEAVKAALVEQRVPILVDRNATTGQQELRLQLLVPNASIFQQNGIEVTNVRPSSIAIYVDVEIDREVEVMLRESLQDQVSAVFTPKTVKISGPSQVFRDAEESGGVRVYANLSGFKELRQPGSHPNLSPVPLDLSVDDSRLELSHSHVEATVEVRQANIEGEIRSVPVWWGGPSNLVNEYAVEHEQFVKNVKVVGPPEQIARLQSETATPPPVAWLIISREDLPAGTDRQKPLEWRMPQGVRVKDENQPYTFRLVPKDGSAP